MLVTVVAPVYNESGAITEFLHRLQRITNDLPRYHWEFIFVEDGSTDGTLGVCRGLVRQEPRLRVIELRRNFGQTAALQAGLRAARGDIIISMDADLQHFPEDIPTFLDGIEEGYDLVCGWRHQRREGIIRRWPSRAANVLIKRVSGIALHDFGTTFRAYRRDLVRHMHILGEQHRFIPAIAAQVGARIKEVPIQNIERPFGKSNYGLGRTLNVFFDIIFLYFSRHYFTKPLKVFGRIALVLFAIGLAIASSLLLYSWVTGVSTVRERGGWFLLSALLMLASLQVLLTGVLAEILVRIYYRTDATEGFVVRQEWQNETADVPYAAAARQDR